MTGQQILFLIVMFVTLASGFVVVTSRNLFHAALAMMLSFLGVAGFYVLLNAGFLAAAQLLVYIGAISILVIFAIMMTRRLMQTTESPFNSQWIWGVFGALALFVILAIVISNVWDPSNYLDGTTNYRLVSAPQPVDQSVIDGMVVEMGRGFVSQYVIPFEVASVLLLAALVGSIVIARPQKQDENV